MCFHDESLSHTHTTGLSPLFISLLNGHHEVCVWALSQPPFHSLRDGEFARYIDGTYSHLPLLHILTFAHTYLSSVLALAHTHIYNAYEYAADTKRTCLHAACSGRKQGRERGWEGVARCVATLLEMGHPVDGGWFSVLLLEIYVFYLL